MRISAHTKPPTYEELDVLYADAVMDILRLKAEARSKWQPIETAPKDGTKVIVCIAGKEYNSDCAFWRRGYWVIYKGSVLIILEFEPTHWMPLPTPMEVA